MFLFRAKSHYAVINDRLGNVDRNVQNWETVLLITYHFSCLETHHVLTQMQGTLHKWLGPWRSYLKIDVLGRGILYFQSQVWGRKVQSAEWVPDTLSSR